MQRKTIKKIVATKMEDWLQTITDESLRKDVKENILVSGGAIASMFLNEQINDFDVYIKDMDVLKRLVDYYAKPFNLEVLDGRKTEYLIQKEYGDKIDFEDASKYLLEDPDYNPQRLSVLRSVVPDQIKIVAYAGFTVPIIESGETEIKKYTPQFFSPNAVSLSDDVQIVCRFHGNAEEIHKTFDFIHATNYFTFDEGLVTNIEALESLITKQLRYQGSLYPLTSIIRAKKFIKRNWNIGAGEYLKIMFQISELNLHDPKVMEDQLIGVDIAYFGKLIEILQGKKNEPGFEMSSQYLNMLIDKVFNDDNDEN